MEGSLGYIERLSLKNNNKKKYRKPSSPRSTISSAGFHLSEPGVRGRREGRGCAWLVTRALRSTHKRQL